MNDKKGEIYIEEKMKFYAAFMKFLFSIVAFSTLALIFWQCSTHRDR